KTYATLIATALFALHPMRVESVVWAAERKDVLYTLFFLLSLILYIHFLLKTRRNNQYYIASIACFILSILSKGQAVVLPLTLILIDYWYDRKITLRSVTNKVPYLFFSLASGILAIVAQHSSLTEQRLQAHSLFERLALAAFNITAYLYKLVFPFDLSCFYKYPASQNMWWVYAGALTAIVVVAAVAILFRKNRIVVFGSLFFLFTVFIVSQILPVGNAIIADRYTYVPYIGLFFIAAMFLDKLITGKSPYSRYFIILPAVILVVFSIKSYAQSTTWHDDFTLYRNALKQDPDNGMAASNLGRAYIDKEDYKTAIEYFNLAIKNEDTFIENFHAYQNLGVVSSRMGNDREAIKYFSTAYARNRSSVDAVFSRGLSYTSLGKLDSAVTDFTTILTSMDSLNTKTYYSRGIAFNKLNMPDRAIADYSAAIRIDPDYCDPYVNRGNIYFAHNSFDAAVADYNKALSLVPDDGNTYLNRSFVYFKMKNYKNALDDALKAQEYKKEVNPNYLNDLRKALKTP
ncbi:MAG: tetratricopeptide repeat protein, partial [Bacteroidota bacterium]